MSRFVDVVNITDTSAVPQPLPVLCLAESDPRTDAEWTTVTAKKRKVRPPRSMEVTTSLGRNKTKAVTSHRR
jgi:hypothetical protein